MRCHDSETWHFPSFGGSVEGTDLEFHLWDAVDDFRKTSMSLLFEGSRLYLHNTEGFFGAVPMKVAGEALA